MNSEQNHSPLILLLVVAMLLSSCGVYGNRFQCPPGKGVGCAPVGEVLDLIVEKEEGDDLFIADKEKARVKQYEESQKKKKPHSKASDSTLQLVKNEYGDLILIQVKEEQSYGGS